MLMQALGQIIDPVTRMTVCPGVVCKCCGDPAVQFCPMHGKNKLLMRPIKVTFSDGDTLHTSINGTDEEINRHYLGQWFNHGDTWTHPADKMVRAVKVEFLEEK